ncbi:monoamine oxidase [Variovorax sp. HW608]|uniref:flavin monoamine oxidase family protein n=1 Tax=Variovorax sp. HW608 TaxID=1034889 RepID=UPI00081F9866|nr:FAD-dependent oxidoreductase [Variovorax sp. HW608]SCK17974.1 monoamine oxidase [Variovorax sp. HW608]
MALVEALMADVAIVGAGLCGLALARTLHARGMRIALFEARERIGGRVLTRRCEATGQPLDLGPAWFWPDTEPRIAALLDELGLPSVAQHDPGDSLWLTDPNREPERRDDGPGGVHAGAGRIAGGAARLADALAATLPPGCLRLGQAVRAVRDRGAFIELLQDGGRLLRARRVVLALPPRLVQARIRFDPALPAGVSDALEATPTWMAAQAKAVTTFTHSFWRDAGHSGNAFVQHLQAVLGQVYDASEGADGGAALGGFLALDAAQRRNFQRGLPMLIDSQLAQLYGPQAQHGHQHFMDWAEEVWTCAEADRDGPPAPPQPDPLLRQPQWAGRLFFGGSETAAHGAGHMEGALETADRIAHTIGGPAARHAPPASAMAPGSADDALAAFGATVRTLRALAPERYRQHLTRRLSGQQSEQLTQRALLASADQTYSEALARLDGLLPMLAAGAGALERGGRHAFTERLLAPFAGWNKELMEAALHFNGTSCALSNFPHEHRPDAAMLRAVTLDLAAAWREFALELNARLLAAAAPQEPA